MADYLEWIRDEELPVLFYETFHGSVGWIIFQIEYELLDFARHQISDDALQGPDNWDARVYSQLKALAEPLDVDRDDLLEQEKDFLHKLEGLTEGSFLHARIQVVSATLPGWYER